MFIQRNKVMLVVMLVIAVIFSLASVMMAKEYVPGTPLKAGFIYVGPIGDLGWSYAHDEARRICEDTFPWLETVYVESVAEGNEGLYIDKLIVEEGCDVIFTTSFGFMDGTLISAQKYPDKIFAHCSGFKRNPNMMTYMADFYQIYYLNGLIAGALTKTNKTAYVGAFPIPELKMYEFSPDHVVSGQIAHWEEIYLDFLAKVYAGVYTAHNLADVDYWWLLKEKAVEMGAKPGMLINPVYEDELKAIRVNDPVLGMISVYDLVMKRLEQMADPSMVFDPFNGPIYDRDGNLKVPAGLRMSVFELTTMDWAVDGIVGPWE